MPLESPARRSYALVALVGGTAIALIAGVASAWLTRDEAGLDLIFGTMVGLLTEVLGVSLALWARLAEAESDLTAQLRDSSAFMRLASRVAATDEPIITERYQRLLQEMNELAGGRYELSSLEAVYDDDQRTIGYMRSHETLRSICPLASTTKDIDGQLTNRSFISSTNAHIEAHRAGIHVIRIFIFVDEEHFELPILQGHLRHLAESGLDCRYIFRNNPAYREAQMIDPDFIVFGEHKVSIGTIHPGTGTVSGAHVRTDSESVTKYIRDFEKLQKISKRFGDPSEHDPED